MRLHFRSWNNTLRKLGFQKVKQPARLGARRTFRPHLEKLERREVLTHNTPPLAMDDLFSATEDQAYVAGPGGVLAGDSDVDGDALAAVLVSPPSHGMLRLNQNGSFRYIPDAHFSGDDSFVYRSFDGRAYSNDATVTIAVSPVNDPPAGTDDSFTLWEDNVLASAPASVLANDSDLEGNSLTAELVSTTENGTLTFFSDGTFAYNPDPDFFGEDWFTYRASDGNATSDLVTVTITVNPVNDNLVTAADEYATNEDTQLQIEAAGVLANDFDRDFDALSVTVFEDVMHGELALAPDGSFVYTPEAGFSGDDSFLYEARDGAGGTSTSLVTITVNPVSDAPEFDSNVDPEPDPEPDQFVFTVDENTPAGFAVGTVAASDSDPGDVLAYAIIGGNAAGYFAIDSASGLLTLTELAALDYESAESFLLAIVVTDLAGLTDEAAVTVLVADLPENQAPIAVDDDALSVGYTVHEDGVLSISAAGVLANDYDSNGDALVAMLVSPPANGIVALSPDGSFAYTPNANYFGSDNFSYQVSDGEFVSNVANVTIAVLPLSDAPDAVDDIVATDEDTPSTISVLSNDTDLDGDALYISAVGEATNGTVTLNSDGTITYTPNAHFHGEDSFAYSISDGQGGSDTAITTIVINSIPDAPVAHDDDQLEIYSVYEDEELVLASAGILANDLNIDGGPLWAVFDSLPAHGTLNLAADGGLMYTPDPDYYGIDTFTYHAVGGGLSSNIATVTFTVLAVNDAPIANADGYFTDEDHALTVSSAAGVLANDTDSENESLTVESVDQPSNGSVVLHSDGSFTYSPNPNFHGADFFTYKVVDGVLESSVATVTIYIASVNDAPLASGDSYSVNAGATLEIDASQGLLANDSDIEGDSLTAQLIVWPDHGTLNFNANGSFNYTPATGFSGTDVFYYLLSDGAGSSATAMVTISVNAAPVIATFESVREGDWIHLQGTVTDDQDPTGYTVFISGALGNSSHAVRDLDDFASSATLYESWMDDQDVWAYVVDAFGAQSESFLITI